MNLLSRALDFRADERDRKEFERTGYINPDQAFRGDQGASQLLGRINRGQWNDWKERFSPYIESLRDYASDPGADTEAAANAKRAVGQAYDANAGAANREREAFGVKQNPAQSELQERQTGIRRTASMVSAGNQARISAQDRQSQILAGGMGLQSVPDKVLNKQ